MTKEQFMEKCYEIDKNRINNVIEIKKREEKTILYNVDIPMRKNMETKDKLILKFHGFEELYGEGGAVEKKACLREAKIKEKKDGYDYIISGKQKNDDVTIKIKMYEDITKIIKRK